MPTSDEDVREFVALVESSGDLIRRDGAEALRADGAVVPAGPAVGVVAPGAPAPSSASTRDDGERRAAEERLAVSERLFRSSFDDAPIGLAVIDLRGRFLRVNRALCELVGYAEAELLAVDARAITHPDDLEDDADLLRKTLDRQIGGYQLARRYLQRDGREVWALLSVSLVRDDRDGPLYFVSQIQDITDRRRIEADLQRAKEVAESASRSKTEFLANMSHEVRTPMAAVLGYADMLLDPGLSRSRRDHALGAIRRNGSHLLEIIDDILDLSKIEAGRVDLERVAYSPWHIVQEVASSLRVRADERSIDMVARPVGPLPAEALLDPTRVRQIVVNLVANAIKFSDPGGRVEIRLGAGPSESDPLPELELEVEDWGLGMTGAQLGQLFVPFQQADSSTTRRFGGTGLGLSITRRLVEAMGGSIAVRSEPGRGSCVTVRIPVDYDGPAPPWLVPDDHPSIADSPGLDAEFAPPRSLSGRVLLAEDSPDNQRILLYQLCRLGLDVEVVDNGRLAIQEGLKGRFDLILMDVQMPEVDGYDAAAALRRAGCATTILALTAHAMPGDRGRCLGAGCDDYLTKPIDPSRLAEALSRYLPSRPADDSDAPGEAADVGYSDLPEYAELVGEYRRSLPILVDRLGVAAATGDLATLERLGHRTRGVAGMYGLPDLGEQAGLIEDAARERQDFELLAELVTELDELVRDLPPFDDPSA